VSLFSVAVGEANKKVRRRILLPVPGSPRTALLFETLDQDTWGRCRKQAEKVYRNNPMMQARQINLALIAACCIEIWQDDVATLLPNGDPAKFTDREVQQDPEIAVATAPEAVAKIVGRDGDVGALAAALMRESGFSSDGEPLEAENPTTDD